MVKKTLFFKFTSEYNLRTNNGGQQEKDDFQRDISIAATLRWAQYKKNEAFSWLISFQTNRRITTSATSGRKIFLNRESRVRVLVYVHAL